MRGRARVLGTLSAAVMWTACASIPGASDWETAQLKQQAATDLECAPDTLSTYDAGDRQYSVRGCGKRARYVRQSCNRVDRSCVFSRQGDIIPDSRP
jgi:hypothetical protein